VINRDKYTVIHRDIYTVINRDKYTMINRDKYTVINRDKYTVINRDIYTVINTPGGNQRHLEGVERIRRTGETDQGVTPTLQRSVSYFIKTN
jgi:hypothetical protein